MLHFMRLMLAPRVAGFAPVTRTFNSGSGSDTVPTGATQVTIRAVGPGGSGAKASTTGAGGAGSGAYAVLTLAVTGGQSISYTVGTPGAGVTVDETNGNNGTATTVSGTVTGGTINISAGGGFGGSTGLVAGSGGTATGGSTNTSGNAGSSGTGGASVYGGYGPGSNGRQLSTGSSNAGGAGVVILEYT